MPPGINVMTVECGEGVTVVAKMLSMSLLVREWVELSTELSTVLRL